MFQRKLLLCEYKDFAALPANTPLDNMSGWRVLAVELSNESPLPITVVLQVKRVMSFLKLQNSYLPFTRVAVPDKDIWRSEANAHAILWKQELQVQCATPIEVVTAEDALAIMLSGANRMST